MPVHASWFTEDVAEVEARWKPGRNGSVDGVVLIVISSTNSSGVHTAHVEEGLQNPNFFYHGRAFWNPQQV